MYRKFITSTIYSTRSYRSDLFSLLSMLIMDWEHWLWSSFFLPPPHPNLSLSPSPNTLLSRVNLWRHKTKFQRWNLQEHGLGGKGGGGVKKPPTPFSDPSGFRSLCGGLAYPAPIGRSREQLGRWLAERDRPIVTIIKQNPSSRLGADDTVLSEKWILW